MKASENVDSSTRLPDFIIGGAMKSGTSTLHRLLAQHEEIFIPEREVHFFDIDDFQLHPHFFRKRDGTWMDRSYEAHFDANLDWYKRRFDDAGPNQCIGEDTPAYLASMRAPRRIRALLPDVKLIFLLRDPVARTYSHYWHKVRRGRAIYRFEEQLQNAPRMLLQRSFYKRQLERYLDLFPSDQIKIIIFEAFIDDPQATVDDVCRFIGVPPTLNLAALDSHHNPARSPRWTRGQLLSNKIFRGITAGRHSDYLPNSASKRWIPMTRAATFIKKLLDTINLTVDTYPPMQEETRRFLESFLARENAGLSELIGVDLSRYWPYWKEPSF